MNGKSETREGLESFRGIMEIHLTMVIHRLYAALMNRPSSERPNDHVDPIARSMLLQSGAFMSSEIVRYGRLVYRPYFWNSQSRLSNGHTCRVLSHREMQWKWNACCNC